MELTQAEIRFLTSEIIRDEQRKRQDQNKGR